MRLRSTLALALVVAVALLVAGQALAGISKVDGGIEFTYDDPSAGSVSLAGDFNGWNMNAMPLEQDADGVWRGVVDLEPGDYEYKFVVNGSEWVADPENPKVLGDYGNSGLTVNEDGELVVDTKETPISNTPVNSRVQLNGWYRATYDTRSDVPADPRWRLTRPAHEVYLQVNPTVTSVATGSATLRLSTGTGDIKEISADLYSGQARLVGGPFTVTGFYNEELLQFGDPLETVGHRDLPGTVPEEHIPFGRGAQGIIIETSFLDVDLIAAYANLYDLDITNDPTVYDNTETDLLAARLTRGVGPATVGATFTSWSDGWWIDWTGTNSSPHIDQYREDHPLSTSDWFELSNTERLIGVDVDVPVPLPVAMGLLHARAEVALYAYRSLWDMGNKEKVEGEDYSNGAIDVPVGEADGWKGTLVLNSSPVSMLDLRLQVTKTAVDSMDVDDLYVTFGVPKWHDVSDEQYTEVKYDGSPLSLNVFGPAPKRDELEFEFDAAMNLGILDVLFEYDMDDYEWNYPVPTEDDFGEVDKVEERLHRVAATAGADVHERIHLELELEKRIFDHLDDNYENPGMFEAIIRGDVGLWPDWALDVDLRLMSYTDAIGYADDGEGGTEIVYEDERFFAPYLGLVYSPRENVEFRVGYGVNPTTYTDTPVEGRANGRERWLSEYMWEHSGDSWLDAEEALEDATTVGIMAIITF